MLESNKAKKTILRKAREIPVVKEVDVLVVGGGYAGFGAAMCAARSGAETMIMVKNSLTSLVVGLGRALLIKSSIGSGRPRLIPSKILIIKLMATYIKSTIKPTIA